jgi:CheY-like chemotaxis protein
MKPLTILVADDETNIVRIIEYELKKEGYHVLKAYNGKEGLEAVRKHQPHLILTDIMMPIMDGYELCRQVKGDPELKQIPFIFLTAKADEDSRIYGYSIGATKYLTKPVNKAELLKAINLRLKQAEQAKKLFSQKAKKFQNELAVVSIFSLLDMYSIGGWTGTIELSSPNGCKGRVEIKDGQLKRCIIDGKDDQEAWIKALNCKAGTFVAVHE